MKCTAAKSLTLAVASATSRQPSSPRTESRCGGGRP
jgi:hypothetical protein